LGNWILRFSLKLQIVLQIDQAQTMLVRQDVTRWPFSMKGSYICASTEIWWHRHIIVSSRKLFLFQGIVYLKSLYQAQM
jgi:hypothetical protein